jgi:hypothetical protein
MNYAPDGEGVVCLQPTERCTHFSQCATPEKVCKDAHIVVCTEIGLTGPGLALSYPAQC